MTERLTMFEERNLKIDLLALGLLALTVFLAAALLSYAPEDPPGRLVYPRPESINNLCGHSGAIVSHVLLTAFGIGAYYVLGSMAMLTAALLSRHPITEPLVRLSGWLLSLAGFCALASMAVPELSPGPVIGAGGYLGAAGRGMLEMYFASVGAYILVISAACVGVFLATDYLLLRLAGWLLVLPLLGFGRHVVGVGRAAGRRARAAGSAVAASRASEKDSGRGIGEDGPAISVFGRALREKEDVGEEVVLVDQAEEDVAATGQGADPPAGEIASPLRIRKPRKSKREQLIEEIEAAAKADEAADYELPSIDLLLESEPFCFEDHEKEVRRQAKLLEKTFANFGFNVRVVEIQTGPVIAQFEVELEAGLRLSRITGLADDLAIALRVPSVRIVAPIPGKNTVGIEVPNSERQLVRIREVIEETTGKIQAMRIPIFLGKDVSGNPMVVDLSTLPHLLIAGRTGTGKSVCLNSIIVSILMSRRPDEVRMLLVDPKMVELSPYKKIPHLMHPVVTDMRKAEAILAWAVEKMEERYQLLARAGVRHLSVYNQLGEEELRDRIEPESDEEWAEIPRHMPYIVIVADEMADLMMTAAKEVEGHIIRLAQKSRAVGIHLVLATQKPTVDVITGLIKSNLPARIAFEVSSRIDSRVVLDEMGAEKLLGNGDMLFLRPGTSALIRGQGTYLSDDEIAKVIDAVATTEPQFVHELVQLKTEDAEGGPKLSNRDELYEGAVDIVVREGRGSVSLLQRALGIGYGRAARLIDYMEEDGIVGPYNGSQAREILLSIDDWEQMSGKESQSQPLPAAEPKTRRSTKIQLTPTARNSAADSPQAELRDGGPAQEDFEEINDSVDDMPAPWEGSRSRAAKPRAGDTDRKAATASRDKGLYGDEDFDAGEDDAFDGSEYGSQEIGDDDPWHVESA